MDSPSVADEMKSNNDKPLFRDFNFEDTPEVTEVESMCMNCHDNGVTRLLLTRIPHFRDVIVSSFSCELCGYSNNLLDSAGAIADRGVRYTLKVLCQKDLNRQVVRCAGSEVSVMEVDANFPCSEGNLSTVEGVLRGAAESLEALQPVRRISCPEVAAKIDEFLEQLLRLQQTLPKEADGSTTPGFRFILDDPSGRSWVENPRAPMADPQLAVVHYSRTVNQNEVLHLTEADAATTKDGSKASIDIDQLVEQFDPKAEVVTFQVNCPECSAPAHSNMKMVEIPFFKETVIMATCCDTCGFRDNEVKGGAGIEPLGRRLELTLRSAVDLSRDVLKSDTCNVAIPAIELDSDSGTLGGRFTTVEGLMIAVRDQLSGQTGVYHVVGGDGAEPGAASRMDTFLAQLQAIIDGRRLDGSITLVMDDPASNSYIQSLHAPEPDPDLNVVDYKRTAEQNDLLGLTDMCTEGYETSASGDTAKPSE